MKVALFFACQMALCFLFFERTKTILPDRNTPCFVSSKTPDELFDKEEPLEIKLSGNIRTLVNDRKDDAVYHPLTLTYKGVDNNDITINIRAKTRGNFRRKKENCSLPPILLNFSKKETGGTLFSNQDKLKLVTPCQSDNYVIREYLVYKLYNQITPKSFRARLVKVLFNDTEKKKETSFYGILLEEDERLAERNGLKVLKGPMLKGENTETETFLKMALFQYMIGNTDWSVPYRHNIRILSFDSSTIPYTVPYDFDHAGIVQAPYALPPEELELRSTQERRFRGYCITDRKTLEEVIGFYKRKKNEFYNVYTSCTLIEPKYLNATKRFLDAFYETLNDPKDLNAALSYPCNKKSPNYVIKGLRN